MTLTIPPSWQAAVGSEAQAPYFAALSEFVAAERAAHQVFPPEEDTFAALQATAFQDVRVVLLGQDPYHDDGQAHGMCFSVRPGVRVPPSLRNMYKELSTDLGCTIPDHGYLTSWADQGVLLLNTVMTVRAHEAASHKGKGWETFTDAVILWGAHAKKKAALIDADRHRVIQGAHPSPLSAKLFMGSKPFSAANKALEELGLEPVDWQVPPLAG
jgi:uracil-DNA glycosylase